MSKGLVRFGVGIFVAIAGFAFMAQAAEVVVVTQGGKVSGVASDNGAVTSFKGIPFAAPPVGPLRWRAPQPAAPWTSVRKADHFGASCMQGPNTPMGPWTKEYMYVTPASEDCLYLNIWTPKTAAAARLPVLVYIYGGGFTSGSGDVPVYDGTALAKTGMVVVTFNYRVGPFGFLAHPELTAQSDHHASGNYGLMDQIAALHWVQGNIGAFGGDPARVAIAGQSAGAMSVEDLLASPLAKGLFHAAIADSGIGGRGVPVRSLAEAEKAGAAWAAAKKADSLAALRALPAANVLGGGQFSPIVDGWVVPDQPMMLTTSAGRDNDVPVITGFQADDFRMAGSGPPMTAARFEQMARTMYGGMADEFLKLYPAKTDEEAKQSETLSARDRARSGMVLWATKRAATHKSPVYVYFFDRAIPWPAHPEFGAFHSGELPYTFGNLKVLDRPWEPADQKIAHMMMTYWKGMTARGNPNGAGEPRWEPVSSAGRSVMRLGVDSGPMATADDARFAFWKKYFESEQSKTAPIF
ncbi:MAG TPA: carboxylesterase family protein [Terracidiphilus sp.]